MPDLELRGCRSRPLMPYLKALGVMRHLGPDPHRARLWWRPQGHAVLRSDLDASDVVRFFLQEYEPSPITSPWNGGSGYHEGDNTTAIRAIEASDAPRLASVRETIACARRTIADVRGDSQERMPDKERLLERWRALAPDPALEWLDATMALTDEGPAMSPLLGTGGNDGRFEFSNNFMQCLMSCLPSAFEEKKGQLARSRAWLSSALYAEGDPRLDTASVGMFDPGSAGLPNSSSSARVAALVNPWDFVLMLEGALLFGGGVGRRLAGPWASFPFTVTAGGLTRHGRSLAPAGDASTRGETWLPIWHEPASLPSLRRLLAEGRAQDGRAQAQSGRTFSRAAASMGVERGIASFERMVHVQRFSRMYLAVPAGRVQVRANPRVELLRSADGWLARVRRIDAGGVRQGVARIEREELEAARGERGALERWLLALADLQLVVGRRPASRDATAGIRPLQGLPDRLVHAVRAESGPGVEWELAQAISALGRARVAGQATDAEPEVSLRTILEPLAADRGGRYGWHGDRGLGRGLSLRRPEELLAGLAAHSAVRQPPESRYGAGLGAVAAFLAGETDDERLVRLAFALSLCRPTGVSPAFGSVPGGIDRLYALARLVTGRPTPDHREGQGADAGERIEPTPAPGVVAALAAGHAQRAARLAVRRLHADRAAPFLVLGTLSREPPVARRIAAALAIPVTARARDALTALVLRPAAIEADPQGGTPA